MVTGLGLVSAGCGSSDSGPVGPEKSCLDVADAIAKAAVRCNLGTDQDALDGFIQGATNGAGCKAIIKIRDESSLRSTCIPSLSTISCTDLQAATLDASCRGQLLRNGA